MHELGHFLMAKRAGVKVEEFAFGFKPRLWGKKIGETTYAINLIPLGGYVKMLGEGDEETGPSSFRSKSIADRFKILIAGSVMNLLLGWLLLTILFATGFDPLMPGVGENPFVSQRQSVMVKKIASGSPAELAGLEVGGQIVTVDGQKMATITELLIYLSSKKGVPIELVIAKDGSEKTYTVTPRVNPPAGEGTVGVQLASEGEVSSAWYLALPAGLYETGRVIVQSAQGFVNFLGDLILRQRVSDDVTGLIGVGAVTGIVRRMGLDYLLQLAMLVSIGLGVVNLMPILPLDGGHIALLAYEKVRGRPLSEKKMGYLVTAGLVLVGIIFVVVTYKDIIRFNVFERLF